MRIIEKVSEMQQQAESWRQQGKVIGLIPTMGYLHEGHLTLMRAVRPRADVVVTSIFVNPTQFGPGEDFEKYPRDPERDIRLAGEAQVDVVFVPQPSDMYSKDFQTRVEVTEISKPLCGMSRPGHFQGVATVVAKLFNIVKPRLAIFGEKDFQQLAIIRKMAADLNMDVEIMGHPIVREADGLAMSSRNVYLDPDQRIKALRLSRSLNEAQKLAESGERRTEVILQKVRSILKEPDDGDIRIDYADFRHPETLEQTKELDGPALMALAVFVGSTRLIDNRILQTADFR